MSTGTVVQESKGERARRWYERLRPQVETDENIGKIMVIDLDTGELEIDPVGLQSAQRLQSRRPDADLFWLRIGHKAVVSFGGSRLPFAR